MNGPIAPMTARIDHVVRFLRQQSKSRSEVLSYFAPEDRKNAGDRQRAEAVNAQESPRYRVRHAKGSP